MEHCRLRAGNRSSLVNGEPLVEVGERSDDEDVFDRWRSHRRRGVVEEGLNDG
jgi:hypothetical protein